MTTIVYILIGVLIIIVIYLVIKLNKINNNFIVQNGSEIIFKGNNNEPDWVLKRINNKLITGIKSGNTIIQKSTI